MKEKCEDVYDERQILERGRAFRNGYISLFLSMLVCYFVKNYEVKPLVDDFSAMVMCFWLSIVVISVTMIVRNAYDGIHEGRNAVIVSIMGALGLFALIVEIIKGFCGSFDFYSSTSTIFISVSLFVIFTVYRVKRWRDGKQETAARDEIEKGS